MTRFGESMYLSFDGARSVGFSAAGGDHFRCRPETEPGAGYLNLVIGTGIMFAVLLWLAEWM